MSALFGLYSTNSRPIERADLTRMADALAHRGPDGGGVWHKDTIALGHQMLWTTPESLVEQLPYTCPLSTLTITADARLDHRDELLAQLGLSYPAHTPIPDSHVILAAYEKWGEECPNYLLGDFAFVIWDGRRQILFAARDPMGVKPFYYYYHPNWGFAFASEIRALLTLPFIPCRLNEMKIGYHLVFWAEERTATFYEEIVRLPAAHRLRVSPEGMQTRCYWTLDPTQEIRMNRDEEYAEAFRHHFTEAVRWRVRSAFPVGSTLSGGLDSSSIACTARQLLAQSTGQPLHTFSAIFPDLPVEDLKRIDERYYIRAVQELGGFKPHEIHADQLNPLDQGLWDSDEVSMAPNLYIHKALYEAAHRQGVRVFLDGIDGDSTVFYGWPRLTELLLAGQWTVFLDEIKAAAKRYRVPRRQILWQYGVQPLAAPLLQLWQQIKGQPGHPLTSIINRQFSQRIGLTDHIQTLTQTQPQGSSSTRAAHWQGLMTGLHQGAMEITDKASAPFHLEPRYPFYDRRLMEFCLALPASQKFQQGWPRFILRQAMTNILPPVVQWRISKGDLSPSFQRKLLEYEQHTIEEVIKCPHHASPYINVSELETVYSRYCQHPVQCNQEALEIFSFVTLALWLNRTPIAACIP